VNANRPDEVEEPAWRHQNRGDEEAFLRWFHSTPRKYKAVWVTPINAPTKIIIVSKNIGSLGTSAKAE
jgi:hypothetical protein